MVSNDDNNVLSHSDRRWGSSSRKYSDEISAVTFKTPVQNVETSF